MEIRRFGIGHRRREGLTGAHGVTGQGIHDDPRGHVAELAFDRHASIPPHSNPNTTWFVVIEGGGFVQVGTEKARVAPGEAILWPANVTHAAWTEQSPMRAIVVEFAGSGEDEEPGGLLVEGESAVVPLDAGGAGSLVERGEGSLTARPGTEGPRRHSPEREPW